MKMDILICWQKVTTLQKSTQHAKPNDFVLNLGITYGKSSLEAPSGGPRNRYLKYLNFAPNLRPET